MTNLYSNETGSSVYRGKKVDFAARARIAGRVAKHAASIRSNAYMSEKESVAALNFF